MKAIQNSQWSFLSLLSKHEYHEYSVEKLTVQIGALRRMFPAIDGSVNQNLLYRARKGLAFMPEQADGWFAVINRTKNRNVFGVSKEEILVKILAKIEEVRLGKFRNYCLEILEEIHSSIHTSTSFCKLSEIQGHPDILIIPAQLGASHKGSPCQEVRKNLEENEFCLPSCVVGDILLTHPTLLRHRYELAIDCAGDEAPALDYSTANETAPFFLFRGGKLSYGRRNIYHARGDFGSATGFIPQ